MFPWGEAPKLSTAKEAGKKPLPAAIAQSEKDTRELFDIIKGDFDFTDDDYEGFKEALREPGRRREFFDIIKEDFDFSDDDYEGFERKLGFAPQYVTQPSSGALSVLEQAGSARSLDPLERGQIETSMAGDRALSEAQSLAAKMGAARSEQIRRPQSADVDAFIRERGGVPTEVTEAPIQQSVLESGYVSPNTAAQMRANQVPTSESRRSEIEYGSPQYFELVSKWREATDKEDALRESDAPLSQIRQAKAESTLLLEQLRGIEDRRRLKDVKDSDLGVASAIKSEETKGIGSSFAEAVERLPQEVLSGFGAGLESIGAISKEEAAASQVEAKNELERISSKYQGRQLTLEDVETPSDLFVFVGQGVSGSLPGSAAAIFTAGANYAGNIYLDMVRLRSEETGKPFEQVIKDGDVDPEIAIATAGLSAATDILGARVFASTLRAMKGPALRAVLPKITRSLGQGFATEAAQSVVEQAGTSYGATGEVKIDPVQAIGEGIVGMGFQGLSVPTGLARAGRDAVTSYLKKKQDATEVRVEPQGDTGQYQGTPEQQQGQEENRVNQEGPVAQAEAAPSSSDSVVQVAPEVAPRAVEKFGAEIATRGQELAAQIPGLSPAYQLTESDLRNLQKGEDVFRERLSRQRQAVFTSDNLESAISEAQSPSLDKMVSAKSNPYESREQIPPIAEITYEQALAERFDQPVSQEQTQAPTRAQEYDAKMRAVFKRAENGYFDDPAEIRQAYDSIRAQYPEFQPSIKQIASRGPQALADYLKPIIKEKETKGLSKNADAIRLLKRASELSRTPAGLANAIDLVESFLQKGEFAAELASAERLRKRLRPLGKREGVPSNITRTAKTLASIRPGKDAAEYARVAEILLNVQKYPVQSIADAEKYVQTRLAEDSARAEQKMRELGVEDTSLDIPEDAPKEPRIYGPYREAQAQLAQFDTTELSDEQKSQVDALLKTQVESLSPLQARKYLYTMSNIIANGTLLGFGGDAKAYVDAKQTLKRLSGRIKSEGVNNIAGNIDKSIEAMLPAGLSRAAEYLNPEKYAFLSTRATRFGARTSQALNQLAKTVETGRQLGLALEQPLNRAMTAYNKDLDESFDEYSELSRSLTPSEKAVVSMVSFVRQYDSGSTLEASFDANKEQLLKSITNKLNSNDALVRKTGEVEKSLYDSYIKDATPDTVMLALSPKQAELYTWILDFFAQHKEALFENEESYAGKAPIEVMNYVPWRAVGIGESETILEADILNEGPVNNFRSKGFSPFGSESLIARRGIGSDRSYVMSLDIVMQTRMSDILYDVHTRAERARMKYVLDMLPDLIGKENAQVVANPIIASHLSASGTGRVPDGIERLINTWQQRMTPLLLSSIRQPFQQVLPALAGYAARPDVGGPNALYFFAKSGISLPGAATDRGGFLLNVTNALQKHNIDIGLAYQTHNAHLDGAADLVMEAALASRKPAPLTWLAYRTRKYPSIIASATTFGTTSGPDYLARVPGFLAGYTNALKRAGVIDSVLDFDVDKHLDNYEFSQEIFDAAVLEGRRLAESVQGRSIRQDRMSAGLLTAKGKVDKNSWSQVILFLGNYAANMAQEMKLAIARMHSPDPETKAAGIYQLASISSAIVITSVVAAIAKDFEQGEEPPDEGEKAKAKAKELGVPLREDSRWYVRALDAARNFATRGISEGISMALGGTSLTTPMVRYGVELAVAAAEPEAVDGLPISERAFNRIQSSATYGGQNVDISLAAFNVAATTRQLSDAVKILQDPSYTDEQRGLAGLSAGLIAFAQFGVGFGAAVESSRSYIKQLSQATDPRALDGERTQFEKNEQIEAINKNREREVMRAWANEIYLEVVKPRLSNQEELATVLGKQMAGEAISDKAIPRMIKAIYLQEINLPPKGTNVPVDPENIMRFRRAQELGEQIGRTVRRMAYLAPSVNNRESEEALDAIALATTPETRYKLMRNYLERTKFKASDLLNAGVLRDPSDVKGYERFVAERRGAPEPPGDKPKSGK